MSHIKEIKRSYLDEYEMQDRTFDSDKNAIRVTIVDNMASNPATIAPNGAIQVINVPEIVKETEIHQINVPILIKEVQIVEIPVIIKEIEYKTIQVPVIVPEIKIIEVEKLIIVKEIQIIEKNVPITPNLIKICMIIQTITLIGLVLTNLLRR
jgi:hypothetical protein